MTSVPHAFELSLKWWVVNALIRKSVEYLTNDDLLCIQQGVMGCGSKAFVASSNCQESIDMASDLTKSYYVNLKEMWQ